MNLSVNILWILIMAPALVKVTDFAKQMKRGLILGTCYKEMIKGKEYCYNQIRVYTPVGKFLGAYSKILRCSSLRVFRERDSLRHLPGMN